MRFLLRLGRDGRALFALTATDAGASAGETPTPLSRKTFPHRCPARIPLSPSGEGSGVRGTAPVAPGARPSLRRKTCLFVERPAGPLDGPWGRDLPSIGAIQQHDIFLASLLSGRATRTFGKVQR